MPEHAARRSFDEPSTVRVIVTRPAAQAAEWVARLNARGLDAAALPLIGIAPPADPAAVRAAWAGLAVQRLVVFVSPNAVEQFFALRPAGAAWPPATWAGSPGPGTTQALLGSGLPAEAIVAPPADAAQFDSEALWAVLAARPAAGWGGERVLIVRGDGGRDWLGDTLRAHGASVAHLSAYRRTAPVFGPAESELLTRAVAAPAGHVWLFSSSEAIDHLAAALPAADWSGGRAVATHPRIAARARRLGMARVAESPPGFDAVMACIQSFGP